MAHHKSDPASLRNVVITGATTGIGLETTRQLIRSGEYRVLAVGRNQAALDSALKNLGPLAEFVLPFVAELSDPQEVQKLAERILGSHKKIYGLVNNAGIYPFGGLQSTTLHSWNETLAINLNAPFLLSQALAPALAKHPGGARIVNISSTAGILPNHFALAYSVSKAALIQLTKTLAKELGKSGITVNCICPGIVKSPMHEAYHHNSSELEQFYAKRGGAYPMGRVGEPADVASAIRFILSAETSWLTGDVLIIDGGRMLT
jgi:meso-butanediol dehydrogenase/(S,S)-butanediol dehydrogenase/diacetyl reductase